MLAIIIIVCQSLEHIIVLKILYFYLNYKVIYIPVTKNLKNRTYYKNPM